MTAIDTEWEQMLTRIRDISQRRKDAFEAALAQDLGLDESLGMIPEATTPEDIQTLKQAHGLLDDFAKEVLDVYSQVWAEWGRVRCGVCSRTAKQAAADGHDCTHDC